MQHLAMRVFAGLFLGFLVLSVGWVQAVDEPPPTSSPKTGGSGLPVPRFVSLKSDKVNLRSGPGTEYPTSWVFQRAGLPVEIFEEFDVWRRVRDAQGVSGWVLHSLVSGRRTALILPWDLKDGQSPPVVPVYRSDSVRSGTVASVEAGVIANVHACDGTWCRVSVGDYKGYIEQVRLWGVYEHETVR